MARRPAYRAGPTVDDHASSVRGMIIDCGTCTVRGTACHDCVVTFLTIPVRESRPSVSPVQGSASSHARHGASVDLDDAERHAIDLLARSGLVPPLRMRAV